MITYLIFVYIRRYLLLLELYSKNYNIITGLSKLTGSMRHYLSVLQIRRNERSTISDIQFSAISYFYEVYNHIINAVSFLWDVVKQHNGHRLHKMMDFYIVLRDQLDI